MAEAIVLTIDEVDLARSREYSLLSTLLLRSPDKPLLDRLGQLEGDGSPIGLAHSALAEVSRRLTPDQIAREYFELFVGVGRGELVPYASFYLTGSLYGRPLAALRHSLQRLGIERSSETDDPEDHAGILCEILVKLINGSIPAPPEASREFFVEYLAPWMGRLFGDLEHAKSADFYARIGVLGRILVDLEIEALKLPM
jgi:TorA maturation chaperone TorD